MIQATALFTSRRDDRTQPKSPCTSRKHRICAQPKVTDAPWVMVVPQRTSVSYLVGAIWLACISQILWLAVRVLNSLSLRYFIKNGPLLSRCQCVWPRRRVGNFTP
jgi:hypothetical protein